MGRNWLWLAVDRVKALHSSIREGSDIRAAVCPLSTGSGAACDSCSSMGMNRNLTDRK